MTKCQNDDDVLIHAFGDEIKDNVNGKKQRQIFTTP